MSDDQSGMLPLENMPRRLLPAFPTRLTTWQQCRRRYRYAYLDSRPKAGPWAHYSVGSSVHEALRRWWDLPVAERTPDSGAALVSKHWIDQGFRDDAQCQQARERAMGWVREYLATQNAALEPIGLERTISTVTEVLSVRGKVDRIDQRRGPDGERYLAIVDYKTSRRAPSDDDARSSLQLAMYAAAAERTLRTPCPVVELHHLPSGTIARWEYRPGQLSRHLGRADDLGLEAAAAEAAFGEAGGADRCPPDVADSLFPPTPEPSCAWCDFRSSCPEGARSSTPVTAWAALDRAEVPPGALASVGESPNDD